MEAAWVRGRGALGGVLGGLGAAAFTSGPTAPPPPRSDGTQTLGWVGISRLEETAADSQAQDTGPDRARDVPTAPQSPCVHDPPNSGP